MGWNPFKKITRAIKKVARGIKKVVKKTIRGIKKVVKKISSSKILKALAIAAAVIVTGGAALTAFGGTSGLSGTAFGKWMMSTSQSVLGGSYFGTGGGFLAKTGNFVTKTIAKPFGAVGGALGSTARVGANLLNPNATAFQAGPGVGGVATTPGAILTAPTPFSAEAFSGQLAVADTVSFDPTANAGKGGYINTTVDPLDPTKNIVTPLTQAQEASLPNSYTSNIDKVTGKPKGAAGRIAETVATGTATAVLSGAALQAIQGDPEQQGSMGGLRTETATQFDPLQVYAANRGIAESDISKYFTFGNTASAGNMPLFQQQTIGVPS
tara:strand:+ start:173 stop:1147 length:975 start_codon:yes stop_codon:yes gene_type:complete